MTVTPNRLIRTAKMLLLLFMLAASLPVCASGMGELPLPAELPAETSPEKVAHPPGLFDIDLSILISQTINFFVLLFILNRFLFKPVGKLIEERRDHLGRIKIATESEYAKALEFKAVYEKHLENIEEEIYQIKQNAILQAKEEAEKIVTEGKEKAEEIVERGELELFMERQTAWAGLREDVVKLTLLAAEKVVEESLDDELHQKLINKTIDRLEHNLPDHI